MLLKLNSGKSYSEVSREVGMTYISMRDICDKYINKGENNPHLNIYQTSLAVVVP